MNLLEIENIKSGYGQMEILHGVSLSIQEQEILTIIGPNGAGKSTLLKTIMGYLPIWDGELRFDGNTVTFEPPENKVKLGIAYVPQVENIFPGMSVKETLLMGGYTLNRATRKDRMEEIFDLFPLLRERSGQISHTLSGGERQMLAMGRALMTGPSLILLDEPSAGLAPQISEEVFQQIKLVQKTGSTIAIVEQDARGSLSISDKGCVLKMGEKVLEESARKILKDTDLQEAYLGI